MSSEDKNNAQHIRNTVIGRVNTVNSHSTNNEQWLQQHATVTGTTSRLYS